MAKRPHREEISTAVSEATDALRNMTDDQLLPLTRLDAIGIYAAGLLANRAMRDEGG